MNVNTPVWECLYPIQAASSIGLLHLASVLLAIVGLLLAIGGVVAFLNFRGLARRQAREEAKKIAPDVAEKVAILRVVQLLPQLVEEYRKLGMSAATNQSIEEIAQSQDDGEDPDEPG